MSLSHLNRFLVRPLFHWLLPSPDHEGRFVSPEVSREYRSGAGPPATLLGQLRPAGWRAGPSSSRGCNGTHFLRNLPLNAKQSEPSLSPCPSPSEEGGLNPTWSFCVFQAWPAGGGIPPFPAPPPPIQACGDLRTSSTSFSISIIFLHRGTKQPRWV